QAEDGIRDFHVTGVQTCALPISSNRSYIQSALALQIDQARGGAVWLQSFGDDPWPAVARAALGSVVGELLQPVHRIHEQMPQVRSEERRVGKECGGVVAQEHGRE